MSGVIPVFIIQNSYKTKMPDDILPPDDPRYDVLNKMPKDWSYQLHDECGRIPDLPVNTYLPDMYERCFHIDGCDYYTVQHYVCARRYIYDPNSGAPLTRSMIKQLNEKFMSFTLNSKSKLSCANGVYAKLACSGEAKDGFVDYDRRRALYCKFWQNADLRDILLATRGAILKYRPSVMHEAVVDHDMMTIRDYLCCKLGLEYVARNVLTNDPSTYTDEFIYRCISDWQKLAMMKSIKP